MNRPKLLITIVLIVLALAGVTAGILLRVGFLALKDRHGAHRGSTIPATYDADCGAKVDAFRRLGSCEAAWSAFNEAFPACRGSRVKGVGYDGTYEQQIFTIVDCLDHEGKRDQASEALKAARSWGDWPVLVIGGRCPGREFVEAALEARVRRAPPCLTREMFDGLVLKEAAAGDWSTVLTSALQPGTSLASGDLEDDGSCRRPVAKIEEGLRALGKISSPRTLRNESEVLAIGGVGGGEILRLQVDPEAKCVSLTGVFFNRP